MVDDDCKLHFNIVVMCANIRVGHGGPAQGVLVKVYEAPHDVQGLVTSECTCHTF